jgi:hypothetical protein
MHPVARRGSAPTGPTPLLNPGAAPSIPRSSASVLRRCCHTEALAGLRDYQLWHRHYDDPDSDLSWRLRTVQRYIREALDRRSGAVRVLSCCSGDGRDLLETLTRREDAERVSATLIEIHPAIAERARQAGAASGAAIEVRTADGGVTDAYLGAAPADLVLMVGILGNISHADLTRTIAAAPVLCRTGATLIWSRGRRQGDINSTVKSRFSAAGFTELDYATLDRGSWPAAAAMRYDGLPRPLVAGERLFTFQR